MTQHDTRASAQTRSTARISQRRTRARSRRHAQTVPQHGSGATSRCRTRATPWHGTRTAPRRRGRAIPWRCIESTPPRARSTPAPHRAHNDPALPRGPSQEPRNKKSVRIATFLRLAIVASSPIANRGTKTQVICRVKAPISLCRDREESVIAKKLQRCRDFCFHDGRIASMGGYHNGRITATGQITQMCVFSAAARVATPRATDRTKRPPPGLAGSGWAAARVQRGLLRIGRSGSP